MSLSLQSSKPPIPSELTGRLPREPRASRNGVQVARAALMLLVLAVAVDIWSAVDTVGKARQMESLRGSAREASAEITQLWSPRHSSKYKVKYSFTVNGLVFRGEAQVPAQLTRSLEESSILRIQYLPADPAINYPTGWELSAASSLRWIIASVLWIVPAFVMLRALRSERQLISRGSPVTAVITQCSRRRTGFRVKYEFRTGDGDTTVGKGWYQSRPELGECIWVLYLPDNPRLNQPYPSLNYSL